MSEISDKVVEKGKAILKIGPPRDLHFMDGCHAISIGKLGYLSDLRVQLGITAAQAGYNPNEQFEYEIIVKKKQ